MTAPTLNSLDRDVIESVLKMGGGYVLDFSDRTFSEFFSDFGVQIDDAPYCIQGGSKANRLRVFLRSAPSTLVGRVLAALLERRLLKDSVGLNQQEVERYRTISVKLGGISLRTIPVESQDRIWGNSGFRVFLSHKTGVKKETAGLKVSLRVFGMSCFVAHEDIHPTKAWQDEIENALNTMDAFVALMTADFHDSQWTDQEVGFALGRGVPIIAVRLGKDPYGFIGKFQALSCGWKEAAVEIAKLFINEPGMLDNFICAASRCTSGATGNLLASVFPSIQRISDRQAEQLVLVYNGCEELQHTFGFNGAKPRDYGEGLAALLTRVTGKKFQMTPTWQLRAEP